MNQGDVLCTECGQHFFFFLPRRLGAPKITVASCREEYRVKNRGFLHLSDEDQFLFLALRERIKFCKGRESMELVAVALRELQEEGRICSFYIQDSYGVDFVVIRPNGEEVPLQVKSSPQYVSKHRRKYSNVPVIGVYRRHKSLPQLLKEEVAKALSL